MSPSLDNGYLAYQKPQVLRLGHGRLGIGDFTGNGSSDTGSCLHDGTTATVGCEVWGSQATEVCDDCGSTAGVCLITGLDADLIVGAGPKA